MSDVINGQIAHWPAPLGRALVHGEGVFRTLLVWNGEIVDASAHHAVMQSDAERLGLIMPALSVWQADSQRAMDGQLNAALRWWLTRAEDDLDAACARSERWVSAATLPARPPECWTQGIRAEISTVVLSASPVLAGIKHLNRLPQVLAGREWLPDQFEALMCDDRGHVVCGTRSNLFWVQGGMLFTPPLDRVGVHGLMHRKIRDVAAGLGIVLREQRITPDALKNAEEIFVTNSLIGLWPVRALAAHQWSVPGPLTRRLAVTLKHPLALQIQGGGCVG